MKQYFELCIPSKKSEPEQQICFGLVNEESELHDIYKLRYQVYSEKEYINPKLYPNQEETDSYDSSQKTINFSAITNGKTIACIRLIIDDPLPTEKAFTFSEPEALKPIPRHKRGELGRFIIIPPDRTNKKYLPRGLVMLFMLATVSAYAKEYGIKGGYSFVKKSLDVKLKKMRVPIRSISKYEQHYPDDGVLARYFNQPNDPVIPMYFLTEECVNFVKITLSKKILFQQVKPTTYRLHPISYTLYRTFLRIRRWFN